MNEDNLTLDTLFHGKGALWQPKQGYRFGIDSVLLGVSAAHLAHTHPPRLRTLDACCGYKRQGLSFLLAQDDLTKLEVVGLERQEELANLAQKNALHNKVEEHYKVLHKDMRELSRKKHGVFDLILLNPPYYGAKEGFINPDPQRAQARHELHGTLGDLFQSCRAVLHKKGLMRVIYPARKLTYALTQAKRAQLHPVRMRFLHDRVHKPAYAVLLDLKSRGSETVIEAPLILRQDADTYTEQVQGMLRGERHNSRRAP